MDGGRVGIAEEWQLDARSRGRPIMSFTELRGDGPGEERLERLSALRRTCFGLAEQIWRQLDCGAHKT